MSPRPHPEATPPFLEAAPLRRRRRSLQAAMRLAGTTLGFKRPRGAETTLPSVRPRPFTNTTPVPPPPDPPHLKFLHSNPWDHSYFRIPRGHAPFRGRPRPLAARPRPSHFAPPFAVDTPISAASHAHSAPPGRIRACAPPLTPPLSLFPPIAARLSPPAPPPFPPSHQSPLGSPL